MSDVIQRENTCCFTGHRPEKLLSIEENIRQSLTEEIENAIASGYTSFISGMVRSRSMGCGKCIVVALHSSGIKTNLCFPLQKGNVNQQAQRTFIRFRTKR